MKTDIVSEGTDKAAPAGIGGLLRGSWAVAAGYAVAAGTMVAIFRAHDPAVWGLAALSAAAVHVVARLGGRSGRDGGKDSPDLDDLPDMVFVLDGEGRLLEWNRQAALVTGITAAWEGDPLLDAVPTTDRIVLKRGLAAASGGRGEFECRLRTADGTTKPCLWLATPLPGPDSTRLLVTVRDHTQGFGRRRELEDQERRYRYMVEMAPNLVAVVAQDRIDYINASGARLLGYDDPAEVLHSSWSGFLCEGESGGSGHLLRADGAVVDIDIAAVPILFAGHSAHLVEARDVTEVNRAHLALRESEERLQGIMGTMVDGIVTTDRSGRIQSLNPAAESIFGYHAREVLGQNIDILLPPSHHGQLAITERPPMAHPREINGLRKDGTVFPIEVASNELRLGEQLLLTTLVRDITERKRSQSRLVVAEKVFEATSEGVMVTDVTGTILWVNNAFCSISGFSIDEVIGENANLLKSGFQDPDFYKVMWQHIRESGQWQGEIWNRRKGGEAYPEWLIIKAVSEGGVVTRYVGIFSDISKHKRAEETIRHLTYYDAVTRLPNRYLFQDRLTQSLERALRNEKAVAVVLVSLDRFKTVNETLGHQTGDALLREVAERLTESVRGEDTVARLRGDTFVCVLTDLASGHEANPVVARVLDAFKTSFMLGGHELFITASLGIAVFPHDATSVDDLLQKAEAAMNRSKDDAENTYHFYTPEMNANTMERLRLETDLRKSIGQNAFLLHYQPKVETATGRIVGAEALVRWNHPELGMVSPGKFIPLAEETGLIVPLGAWVLHAACRQIRCWQEEGVPVVPVAVNISAHQFRQPDMVETVVRVLQEYGIGPELIELELTESVIMRSAEVTIQTLLKLHDHGIHLSIDDFGTGYSSLSYLKRFPIDRLKIDRSFVQDLGSSNAGEEIVGAIIAMAHSLNLTVVAEGVETEPQLAMLRTLKCDEIQGFYYSRPLPAEDMAAVLNAGILEGQEAA